MSCRIVDIGIETKKRFRTLDNVLNLFLLIQTISFIQ